MRIVIPQRLTMAHGIRGGMETQAQSLAQGLQARGHTIHVLTHPHPEGVSEGYEGGVPVSYIGPGSWRKYETAWWEACYQHITHMHRQQPLDLLLSQSAGGLGYIPRVAGELGIPCVAIMHCSMLGELRTRWWDASSARGIYRLVRHIKRLPRMLLLWHKAAPMVDRWIIVSHETAHDVQRELALAPERVVVIRNGIDTTRFKPDPEARKTTRMRMHIPDEAPLFICSGRLEYEKGFQVAIHAIRTLREQFPHVRLLIAGSGFYQQTLQNMAADMQETVLLPGYIPNEEIPALLAAADFFLMPTLRDEGLPMNILEALASGLPVIASRAGGIPSAIEDGHTGILVPRGDSDALAQAAAQLWHNPAQRTAMRTAAREAALKHFSHNHMVDATEQILMKTQKGTR